MYNKSSICLKSLFIGAILCFSGLAASAQDFSYQQLSESRVQAKVPKKLGTYTPFWGVPVPVSGFKEDSECFGSYMAYRKDTLSLPAWFCWNLDLASYGKEKFKTENLFPKGYKPSAQLSIRDAINECYVWAWRKPYGNTCVTAGPLYLNSDKERPYAWYVAVCKKENAKGMLSLGFSSIAFIIPETADGMGSVYQYSTSVNALEYRCGYNLFPKLPAHVQEAVEEQTTYELFCPYQEINDNLDELFEVETGRDSGRDYIEQVVE